MTQLIVTVEDVSLLSELKRAIKMLRGVEKISVKRTESTLVNRTTLKAIEEVKTGKTIKCKDFADYLESVK